MDLEQCIQEMDGKISLLDNKRFIWFAGVIGLYYMTFIGFLTHMVLHSGGFR